MKKVLLSLAFVVVSTCSSAVPAEAASRYLTNSQLQKLVWSQQDIMANYAATGVKVQTDVDSEVQNQLTLKSCVQKQLKLIQDASLWNTAPGIQSKYKVVWIQYLVGYLMYLKDSETAQRLEVDGDASAVDTILNKEADSDLNVCNNATDQTKPLVKAMGWKQAK